MPAPTNQTIGTAIDVGTLPVSITQDVHDSGITYAVWYKYTAEFTGEINVWGFGDLVVYKPTLSPWVGPIGAPLTYEGITGALNVPIQIPVTLGETYYFKFDPNAGNPTPAILTLSIIASPDNDVDVGFLATNDDTAGSVPGSTDVELPLVIMSNLDGSVQKYIQPFVAGEEGDVADTGEVLASDAFNQNLAFYNNDLTLSHTIALTGAAIGVGVRYNRVSQLFYASQSGNGLVTAKIRTIDTSGNVVSTLDTATVIGMTLITPKTDDTVLYFVTSRLLAGAAIRRWDLIGNVLMADLVAGIAGYAIQNLMTLTDGTILAFYVKAAGNPRDAFVKRYDTTGALLNTYAIQANAGDPRLAAALDDPITFWTVTHNRAAPIGFSNWKNVDVATGAFLTEVTTTNYEGGVYLPAQTATPDRSGCSQSCFFFVVRAAIVAGGTITVIKVLDDPTGANPTFDFTAGGGLSPGTFSLQDGGTQLFDPVAAGSGYSIAETADPNYVTTYVVSNGSPINNITVAVGENVVVTVTNTRRGSITVGKLTDPYSPNVDFDFTADSPLSPTAFTLQSDEEQIFDLLAPGTYSLRETLPTGYTPTYLFDNATVTSEAVIVGAGENVTVAVLNELQNKYSGLYKIVPKKRNETVVDSSKLPVDLKIPEPYIITGVIQDK